MITILLHTFQCLKSVTSTRSILEPDLWHGTYRKWVEALEWISYLRHTWKIIATWQICIWLNWPCSNLAHNRQTLAEALYLLANWSNCNEYLTYNSAVVERVKCYQFYPWFHTSRNAAIFFVRFSTLLLHSVLEVSELSLKK